MRNQSMARGFAVLSAAGIITKVMSLLYIPFFIAIIGEEGYGIYAAALQVYVFIYVIGNSGIPVAISKSVSELTATDNYKDAYRVFKIARSYLFIIGLLLSLIMFFTAGPISAALHYKKSKLAIAAISPTILLTTLMSAYRGYFQGRGNMVPTAVSQIIEQIVNMIFTVVFAMILINVSIEAACAGGTIGTSLGALAAMVILIISFRRNKDSIIPEEYRKVKVKRYTYKQLAFKIVNYSIPITVCVGMQYAGNLIDLWNTKSRLLAAGFSDEVATAMYGYLTKYQQLMNAPISIVSALASAVLPAITAAVAINDKKEVRFRMNHAFKLCFMVVIPSTVAFTILSDELFKLLKYGQGSFLLLYGSSVLIFMSVVQIQTSVLQGAGKLYKVTANLMLGIFAKIILNYILIGIPQINIMGNIIGSIVGYTIPVILNQREIRASTGIKVRLVRHVIMPLISCVPMAISVLIIYKVTYFIFGFLGSDYLSNAIAFIASALTGVAVYFYSMLYTGGIDEKDMEMIPSKIRRFIPMSSASAKAVK